MRLRQLVAIEQNLIKRFFKSIPVVNSDGPYFIAWEFAKSTAYVAMFFFIPIEFFFFENKFLSFMAPTLINSVSGYSLNVFTISLLTIMVLEMVLSFITSYYHQGIFVLDRWKIIQNYLKGQFFTDLLSLTFLLLDCTVWR